jgi:hypothetical protein
MSEGAGSWTCFSERGNLSSPRKRSPTQLLPESAALALRSIALACISAYAWRRRRRMKLTASACERSRIAGERKRKARVSKWLAAVLAPISFAAGPQARQRPVNRFDRPAAFLNDFSPLHGRFIPPRPPPRQLPALPCCRPGEQRTAPFTPSSRSAASARILLPGPERAENRLGEAAPASCQ